MSKQNQTPKNTEQGFISRWSRRKAEVAEKSSTLDTLSNSNSMAGMIAHVDPEAQTESAIEEKILTDQDMPPIESLSDDDDYSGFLSPGVSEGLRKLALRKLFYGGKFSIRDGLDDYDDDFTKFPALGDLITSDMKHQMEMKEKRRKEAEEEAERLQAEQEQQEAESTQAEETLVAELDDEEEIENANQEDNTKNEPGNA